VSKKEGATFFNRFTQVEADRNADGDCDFSKGGTFMFITKPQTFFSLLLCGFLTIGCDVGHPDPQDNPSQAGTTIEASGLAYYDADPVSDAQVLFVNADNTELYFTTMTDENGRFALSLDRAGEYEVYIGHATEDGYFGKEYAVTIDTGVMTYDVGEIEVEFYGPLQSASGLNAETLAMYELEYNDDDFGDDFSTVEGELGLGWGCLAIGCSSKCWAGIKAMCCGYSICISGLEGCIPYGKCAKNKYGY